VYCILVVTSTLVLIYKVAPFYGKKNVLVYVSICSLVGSITVMASKGFGIALKLTFAGNNQLLYPSTYVFAIVVGIAVVTQMNYFNKALDIFSTNMWVTFGDRDSESLLTRSDFWQSQPRLLRPLHHRHHRGFCDSLSRFQ
jgi:hypothetical protein